MCSLIHIRLTGGQVHRLNVVKVIKFDHLVTCFYISFVFHQALHDVHKAPSRCRQQRALSLTVLCVHVAACLAESAGYCRITVPRSTMQRGFLLLEMME